MTCQWCLNYRRRGGAAKCVRPGGDGKIIPQGGHNTDCAHFNARKSCTTCEHRCTPDEKTDRIGDDGRCPMWNLRRLESWGGYRKTPDWRSRVAASTQKQQKGEQQS